MDISRDDFRRHFDLLSDEALLEVNRDELVEAARSVYDEELTRRGLNAPPEAEVEGELMPEAMAPGEGEELVLIASYNVPDEASLARGLLQSAEIPYVLQNDFVALGGIELRLLVPKHFEEQAIEILEHELTDEELAAQAEAAGYLEEEGLDEEEEVTGEPDQS